ncbi:unnamed protein product [Ixodes persulcatus]
MHTNTATSTGENRSTERIIRGIEGMRSRAPKDHPRPSEVHAGGQARLVSDEVVGLLDVDAVLVQCGTQILHGERVSLVLARLLALSRAAHLAVLQRVVGDVRQEFLGRERDEAHDPRVACLEARRVQVVRRHGVRQRRAVVFELQQELGQRLARGAAAAAAATAARAAVAARLSGAAGAALLLHVVV